MTSFRRVAVLALSVVFCCLSPAIAHDHCARPFLRGSFLQPDLGDQWTLKQWNREFTYMDKACVNQMVLQWTVDSKYKTTIYPSGLPGYKQNTRHDVVARALDTGDQFKAEIYLGLQINDDWWKKYTNDPKWLRKQALLANAIADDLWKRYGNHPSLTGWYLGFEVDNVNEPTKVEWDRLVAFYRTIGNHLHALTPGKPVMIAPFYNSEAGLDPAQWQQMWEYILCHSPLNILALQDGVGVGHARLCQLPPWFKATHDAIVHARPQMDFWSDTETFNEAGEPMFIQGIVDDMRAEQPYVSNFLSFSFNYYLSPQQANPLYYKTYLGYLRTGKVEHVAPTTPTNLTADSLDTTMIGLSWNASTDNVGVVGYKVWRDEKHRATLYENQPGYVDTGLQPDTQYWYRVAAFDAAGNQSGLSNVATATTQPKDPYGTDLALHKPYTASMPADPNYPDTGGVELTDGKLGRIDYTDPPWQGRNTAETYSFTVDLGAIENIREIRGRWLQFESVGIFLPQQITYSVSNDGVNFNVVGTVLRPPFGQENLPAWYTLTNLTNVSDRYVKADITPSSEVWTFTDEMEIRR